MSQQYCNMVREVFIYCSVF